MTRLSGREIRQRGLELAPLRAQAMAEFEANPETKLVEIARKLGVNRATLHFWKAQWRKKSRKVTLQFVPGKPEVKTAEITFDKVLSSMPDTSTLGVLLLEGFMKKVSDRDNKIEALSKEKVGLQKKYKQIQQELEEEKKARLSAEKQYAELQNELAVSKQLSKINIEEVRSKLTGE